MKIYEKIHFMRQLQGWSQEEMADKLSMSVNGYAKIERGETDLQVSRLEQIAKAFGVELVDIFSFGEKNILYVAGDNSYSYNQVGNNLQSTNNLSEEKLKYELEKAHLIIGQLGKEIDYLKEIIQLLRKNEQT